MLVHISQTSTEEGLTPRPQGPELWLVSRGIGIGWKLVTGLLVGTSLKLYLTVQYYIVAAASHNLRLTWTVSQQYLDDFPQRFRMLF
ncbi:hypothetical protein BDR03DRAFT_939775 [Suillus americanus]|nr:hypothetical protein BDR03DRAFT_939775 [Suillus americanus]